MSRHRRSDSRENCDRIKEEFQSSGGFLYKKSVFDNREFQEITEAAQKYKNKLVDETSLTVAMKRKGISVRLGDSIAAAFSEGAVKQLVQRVAGDDYKLLASIPIEIRSYETLGAGMQWHVDDVLTDPPQVEVILTLENTSDCTTMWKSEDDTFHSIETEPNSVILLRAGGPSHCVTSLKRGKRQIIKCVFAAEHAKLLHGSFTAQSQFGGMKKRSRKR